MRNKSDFNKYLIGIDFGTDSVRSIILDDRGRQIANAVHYYSQWEKGLYCNSSKNQFRHHPKDYLEGLESVLKKVVTGVSNEIVQQIKGISVDTTGSTPVAVNRSGSPLALTGEFEDNPNAMFILWKDHTAVQEAGEITELAHSWNGPDYTKYVGGVYSSEWFWAKMLHVLRTDENVCKAAYSWVELCDWIPYELTGETDVHNMKRSRCAAGHKALWHQEFNGLPSRDFLTQLDPRLTGIRDRLFEDTYTSDQPAGIISQQWSDKLGLPDDVVIGVGAFDAHMGAVGGEIKPHFLSRVMGTSTCDIMVSPYDEIQDNLVHGICGQVDGSVIPGMIGLEAGQSAFGDVYAWYKDVILESLDGIIKQSDVLSKVQKSDFRLELETNLISSLTQEASEIKVCETDPIALDWLNGRRTPDANQLLKGAIQGLGLGSNTGYIFKALAEATCFGARAIVERFRKEGIAVEGIIGLGGVAKKSGYVMQTLANVLNMPIKIANSEHVCARGAAMFAAVAAGIYGDVIAASEEMGNGFGKIYEPEAEKVPIYNTLYKRYRALGAFVEDQTRLEIKEDSYNE